MSKNRSSTVPSQISVSYWQVPRLSLFPHDPGCQAIETNNGLNTESHDTATSSQTLDGPTISKQNAIQLFSSQFLSQSIAFPRSRSLRTLASVRTPPLMKTVVFLNHDRLGLSEIRRPSDFNLLISWNQKTFWFQSSDFTKSEDLLISWFVTLNVCPTSTRAKTGVRQSRLWFLFRIGKQPNTGQEHLTENR